MTSTTRARLPRPLRRLLVLLFWLLVWQLAAMAVDLELLLPAPLAVLERLIALAGTLTFWQSILGSMGRILLGFGAALLLGTLTALGTSRFPLLYDLISPVMSIARTAPVASFIILALVWLPTGTLSIFISCTMVLPIVWQNVSQGIREIDRSLLEMAKVYKLPPLRVLTAITLPSVLPYFLAAAAAGMGYAWKSGIAAEVLSTPKLALGTLLYESKIYLLIPDLFALTAVIILLSAGIEWLMVRLIGRLSRRYLRGGGKP